MGDVVTVFQNVLPPAAALICAGVLYALRWRDKQCADEFARSEVEQAKLQKQLDAALLDARNQRDARISEAQAIVGEYRLHVEAATNAIERLEDRLAPPRGDQ